jgi:hypothetical protein
VLNNWRSDIGKAGHRVVTDLWRSDLDSFASAEGRADYVSDLLMDLRFVYKTPDKRVGHLLRRSKSTLLLTIFQFGRGAFCSDLVSKVYAKHLRKISTEGTANLLQTGGLALATVAVCHVSLLSLTSCGCLAQNLN